MDHHRNIKNQLEVDFMKNRMGMNVLKENMGFHTIEIPNNSHKRVKSSKNNRNIEKNSKEVS